MQPADGERPGPSHHHDSSDSESIGSSEHESSAESNTSGDESDDSDNKERKYQCESCDATYRRRKYLKRHVSLKHENDSGVFMCDKCKKTFSRKDALKRHTHRVHQEKWEAEEKMEGSSASDDENDNIDDKKYRCTICDETYHLRHHLKRHMSVKHGNDCDVFTCDICEKTFSRKDAFKRHTRNVHKENKEEKKKKNVSQVKYECKICHKEYKSVRGLRYHKNVKHDTNLQGLECDVCKKQFLRRSTLMRHIKCVHSGERHSCDTCQRSFATAERLARHSMRKHDACVNMCSVCGKEFNSVKAVVKHEQECREQRAEGEIEDTETGKGEEGTSWQTEIVMGGDAVVHTLHIADIRDLSRTLIDSEPDVCQKVKLELRRMKACKWYITSSIEVNMNRDDEILTDIVRYLRSKNKTTLLDDKVDIQQQVQSAIIDVLKQFELCAEQGSAMRVKRVLNVELRVAKYAPVGGSSYLPLPEWLQHNKKGLINIKNENDEKCFLWSVILGVLRQTGEAPPSNRHRAEQYHQYENDYNMTGIDYPVSIDHVRKFERQNPRVSVSVFGLEDMRYFVPLCITKVYATFHVNLLLYEDEFTSHYVLIDNLSHLMSHLNKHKGMMFWCDFCLHAFTYKDQHDAHRRECLVHGPQKTTLPGPGENILKFKEFYKMLRHDYVIYADFECVLLPLPTRELDPNRSGTIKIASHVPSGFSYIIIGSDGKPVKKPVVYHGTSNVALDFLLALEREVKEIEERRAVFDIDMSSEDEQNFQRASNCYLCHVKFSNEVKKVRDHDHAKEKKNYRGAACNRCNVNLQQKHYVPVFIHNLQNYDGHLIIQQLGSLIEKRKDVVVIPKTKEKYISFSWNNIRFLDSFHFLSSSLDKLAANLSSDELFILNSEVPDDAHRELMKRKGVYCYDYVDSFDVFDEVVLPPKEKFYNKLTREDISDEAYEHAKTVWKTFDMKSLWDYHDLYMKTDVLLLADVMENFRRISMEAYGLDPAHFYTTPGLAFSAALLKSKAEIELLTDIDMHLFIEKGIRGGVASINKRLSVCNNKYIPSSYDKSKPSSYIMYLDANNLYGGSLSKHLPVGGFEWLSPEEISMFDIKSIKEDDDIGFILEADLKYPYNIHDCTNDYPLAPEHMIITDDILSPYQRRIQEHLKLPTGKKQKKLVPNLNNKSKYVVYGTTLQLYVELGLEITKIHRILRFRQAPWLRGYVEFNTQMRQNASSAFAKNFYKLMINSVFGKTIEGLRQRCNVHLCKDRADFRKLVSKPTFHSFDVFDNDLIAVQCLKRNILLNKPIFVGMVVLDVAKQIMYDFHYKCMKEKYKDKCRVMGGDTDSIFYEIQTDDVYEDMKEHLSWFDTSDYPQGHPIQSDVNKKVIGKFKDEMNGNPIRKYVGLRAKMYAFEEYDGSEKKVAKGVDRIAVKKDVTLQDYMRCLEEEDFLNVKYSKIGTDQKHHLFTIEAVKRGLSCYDDKRYILEDGIETLAYGHYKINDKALLDADEDVENYMMEVDDDDDHNENVDINDDSDSNLNMLIDIMQEENW